MPYNPREFMATLYWDINSVAVFRAIFSDKAASPADREVYHVLCETTKRFIGHGLGRATNNDRIKQFAYRFGWRIFGICAYSDAFQHACFSLSTDDWEALSKIVSTSSRSIEIFARLRRLDWRGPLLPWAQYDDPTKLQVSGQSPVPYLPGLRRALQPDLNISFEHPHHTVITLTDTLRRPRYMGRSQQHSDNHIFVAEGEKCVERDYHSCIPCSLCDSPTLCQCRVTVKTGDLVELREYEGKGVGVRCLTTIKKDDIIGEYIGFVEPEDFSPWTPYTLSQTGWIMRHSAGEFAYSVVAEIQPHAIGNWTRFLNHSCDANCEFQTAVVGTRVATIIVAERDIEWGEELTVHYGYEYWDDQGCPCGSANCQNLRGDPLCPPSL